MHNRVLGFALPIIALALACSSSTTSTGSSSGGSSSSGGGSSSGGATADCASLCTAAQAGKCTTIKGNCANFCAAVAAVDAPASCTNQYTAYEVCLGSPVTVCSNSCGAQESAFTNCLTPYCAAHTSDANCATIAGSF